MLLLNLCFPSQLGNFIKPHTYLPSTWRLRRDSYKFEASLGMY